ncbi:matrixin family metalloprotease [Actomonas aquatica]|uniref:Matrixin family metalloprotease n=1 Tax=Actomonas aquatica TaxID=2866162 RepID=A0ABZ1CFE7_9BACT|nr:matrixin family metalloprotease [Opitutus sp. WL0086]WRQ90022.1 matrixin family metalloprotease [Opitutus sp. WL0086]
MRKRALPRLAAFLFLIGAVATLWGYHIDAVDDDGVYRAAWRPGTIHMQVMMPTSPVFSDGATPSAVITESMEIWNGYLGQVQFSAEVVSPGPQVYDNNTNEIIQSDTISGSEFGPYTLAVTISRDEGDDRVESDLIFNTAWTWDSYRGPLQEGREDMRRVALHELGHTLGLLHPDQAQPPQSVTALMNSVVSDLDGLQPDDIAGAQWLYGAPGFSAANDDFAQAEALDHSELTGFSVDGTNIGASLEAGEPLHAGVTGGKSVWWTWVAPVDGSVLINTQGSNFDTILAVYTGGSVNQLQWVASSEDVVAGEIRTSELILEVSAGETYAIAVDGFDGVEGRIRLNFGEVIRAGIPRILSQPRNAHIYYLDDATFTAEVAGQAPLHLQWMMRNRAGWSDLVESEQYVGTQTASLTLTGEAATDPFPRYRLRVSNELDTIYSQDVSVQMIASVPQISDLPSVIDLLEGDTLEITATITGETRLTYQWHRLSGPIPGADLPTLRIENVTVGDNGLYRLGVTGGLGTKYSDWVNVRVLPAVTTGVVRVAAGVEHSLHLRSSGWVMGAGINVSHSLGAAQGMNGAVIDPVPLWEDVAQIVARRGISLILFSSGELVDTRESNAPYLRTISADVAVADTHASYLYYIERDGRLYSHSLSYGAQEVSSGLQDLAIADELYVIDANRTLWRQGDWFSRSVRVSTDVIAVSRMSNKAVFVRGDGTAGYVRTVGSGSSVSVSLGSVALQNVVAVDGGSFHALFLTADGELWAEGENQYGQLGDGTTEFRSQPVKVADGVWTISAGDEISVFAKTDGSVWAMGRGLAAPFGNGERADSLVPVLVSEGPITLPTAPSDFVASKGEHEAWVRLAWGGCVGATYYQIWRSESDDVATAELVVDRVSGMMTFDSSAVGTEEYYYWVRGVNQAGGGPFSVVDVGFTEVQLPSFVVHPADVETEAGGQVWLSAEASAVPAPTLQWQVKQAAQTAWSDIVDGERFAGAQTAELAIFEPGAEWDDAQFRCVATNVAGVTESLAATVQIEPLRAVIDAASGSRVAFYVTADGAAWARGDNANGQLGDGTQARRALPVKVMDDVVDVEVSGSEALFLRADGTLWMRSRDPEDLALGGPTATALLPFRIAEGVVRMEIGASFVLYQDEAGQLWIVGNDVFAAGADAVTLAEPRVVAERVIDFAASQYHGAYVTPDGNLWVGGSQQFGRLGNEVLSDDYSDGPILLASAVQNVALSREQVFFVKANGELWGAGAPLPFFSSGDAGGLSTKPSKIVAEVDHVSVGKAHLLYRNRAGDIGGYGSGNFGLLGPGRSGFTPPTVLGIQATRFMAGDFRSLLIDDTGRLWGMGWNTHNILSFGGEEQYPLPVHIAGGEPAELTVAPQPQASVDESTDAVRLSWRPTVGDVSYAVWRSLDENFESATLLHADWRGRVFYDTSAVGGVAYHYWVTAAKLDGSTRRSAPIVGNRLSQFALEASFSRDVVAATGDVVTLRLEADVAWSITSDSPWLGFSIEAGVSSAEVAVTIDYNDTDSVRVANVTINDQTLTLTQDANQTQGPEFVRQPESVIVEAGADVAFKSAILGLPRPALQWYKDGVAVTGEVMPTLALTEVSEADEGVYTLVAINDLGSATSLAAELTLFDSSGSVDAQHRAEGASPLAGEGQEIANTVTFPSGLSRLRWTVLLPDGWTLGGRRGDESAVVKPEVGATALAEWEWTLPPDESIAFFYTLIAPEAEPYQTDLVAYIETLSAGNPGAVLASPDPLVLSIRRRFHSADSDSNWRLSLSELLRVIELYNTRSGTTRTGRYHLNPDSEDGFGPDTSAGQALDRHHSADTDQNGMLSLSELLRVIELYNTRSGTARTGAYRSADGSEDGYEPAP